MSRLRQRIGQGTTSSFLQKFKGKTATITKQGLAALFSSKEDRHERMDKLDSLTSLRDTENKENMRHRHENLQTNPRGERLHQYAMEMLKPVSQNLKLPRLACLETIQNRQKSGDRYPHKNRSDYSSKNRSYASRDSNHHDEHHHSRVPTEQLYYYNYGRN